jgi:hypothetical protein
MEWSIGGIRMDDSPQQTLAAVRFCFSGVFSYKAKKKGAPMARLCINQVLKGMPRKAFGQMRFRGENDRRGLGAGQRGVEGCPLIGHPCADEHDGGDYGDGDQADQQRVLDKRCAFLVILELPERGLRLREKHVHFQNLVHPE